MATCAITELGFVRVSVQPAFGAADVAMARKALEQLRAVRPGGILLPDSIGAEGLPEWVKSAKQTTDGHLVALAESHGAQLVTFDTGIPGARVI